MDIVAACIAILFFWVASRYYIIPDGRLRIVRIVFFAYLGVYITFSMIFSVHFLSPRIDYLVSLYGGGVLVCILIYFGFLLNHQFKEVMRYSDTLAYSLNIVGIRISTSLKILWVNPEYCRTLLGYTADALIGRPIEVIIHEDDHYALDVIKQYIANSTELSPITIKLQLVKSDFSRMWVLLALQKEISDGQLETIKGGIQDITEEVNQHDYLMLLRDTLDAAKVGITIIDELARTILYVNPYDARTHGYEVKELIGRDINIFAPDTIGWIKGTASNIDQNYVSINISKAGDVFPVRLNRSDFTYGEKTGVRKARVTFCQPLREISPYDAVLLGEEDLLICAMERGTWKVLWVNKNMEDMLCDDGDTDYSTVLASMVNTPDYEKLLENLENFETRPAQYVIESHSGVWTTVMFGIFRGASNNMFLVGRPLGTFEQTEGA